MNFRPIDYDKDVPEVVQLIRNNLDASISQKFFKWKHYENPFGKSYGLLALDNGKIVGLRMFMFWSFFNASTEKYARAIRPVDTVTDEKYRGKGLFKQLTLQGLKDCDKRYDVVFNTPNENSRPGYLKMGWKSIQTIDYFKFGVVNPFKMKMDFEEIEDKSQLKVFKESCGDTYATEKSNEFLEWRYSNKDYRIAAFESPGCFIIYKTSKIKGMSTVIIFEIFGKRSFFQRMLRAVCRKNKTQFIYFYNSKEYKDINFIQSHKRVKPIVVYKEDTLGVFENFNFSLGDLEGKL